MDAPEFRFWTQWRVDGREFAELHVFQGLGEARKGHADACRGGWVREGWTGCHVSSLRVWRWGRVLEDELAGKVDRCDGHGVWGCAVCGRRDVSAAA